MEEPGARCWTGMAYVFSGVLSGAIRPWQFVFKWTSNMLVCLKEQEGEMLGMEVKKKGIPKAGTRGRGLIR